LRAIVDRIRPAVEPLLDQHGDHESDEFLDKAIVANVLASVDQLRHGSLIIEELIDEGQLSIVGAEYSIEAGTIEFLTDD
jgi:carbonic anhydrase